MDQGYRVWCPSEQKIAKLVNRNSKFAMVFVEIYIIYIYIIYIYIYYVYIELVLICFHGILTYSKPFFSLGNHDLFFGSQALDGLPMDCLWLQELLISMDRRTKTQQIWPKLQGGAPVP